MAKAERSRILRVGSNKPLAAFRSSLDLSAFAKGPASRISRAPKETGQSRLLIKRSVFFNVFTLPVCNRCAIHANVTPWSGVLARCFAGVIAY